MKKVKLIKRDMKREAWLRTFEQRLTKMLPELKGKIDWARAIAYYDQGVDPKEGVGRYVTRLVNESLPRRYRPLFW